MRERTVTLDTQFQVSAVVAHHIYQGLRQFVAVLLVYPALDGLNNLGVIERVDVVPALAVTAIRGEETFVMQTFKGHAEVVALRV